MTTQQSTLLDPATAGKNQNDTTALCSVDQQQACSLLALIPEWHAAVAKKWKEVRALKGHWIAIYCPKWGYYEDLRRRRETSMEVMQWTVQWFTARGYQVECQIMADGESIGIREANDLAHTQKGRERGPDNTQN